MIFIEPDDLPVIFTVISKFYTKAEEIPSYNDETEGINRLIGVLERAQMNLYPTFIDKVVCLFVNINKGHFFSNGNKRLSLVVTLGFVIINDKKINELSREEFRSILITSFPACEENLDEHKEFSPEEYALYNLSMIVADSQKYLDHGDEFDDFKEKLRLIFNQIIVDEMPQ